MKQGFLTGFLFALLLATVTENSLAQQAQSLWHNIQRQIHYKPEGEDFIRVQGNRRFNRALYGGNTAFRAEAGDLPEFALYLPGMGGNLKFGLVKGDSSKWLIDAQTIKTRYRPGSVLYKIKDDILGKETLSITAIALYDREGFIVKIEASNLPSGVKLIAAYGGATGQKFSRDGDIGADPESSFYLKPEYCNGNVYRIHQNAFTLHYGSKSLSEEERYEIQYKAIDTAKRSSTTKRISGVFPLNALLKLSDPKSQSSPMKFYASQDSLAPSLAALMNFSGQPLYFFLQNGDLEKGMSEKQVPALFSKAEATREALAARINVSTPDPFINTLGGALSVAADAVWEDPSYLHGAVAWRMRLPGWRGAYSADVLGWHDRARRHFNAYAPSQVTSPHDGPVVMDTALHLGRGLEKMGTSLFSSGYISRNPGGDQRPHHYDMNLVFVDGLLNHYNWTGDTSYVRQMWPLHKRHLAWEDRNFDRDGNNLYDAYAAIWASDALQYSGGDVTHSSAYNYKAYKLAAELAPLVGEDAKPYRNKAEAILKAINNVLWMPGAGVYAEYRDLLGERLLHPTPAVWTVYHAVDSDVPDAFQAYQSLRWIDKNIPRIPIRAKRLTDTTLYTISTSNWQPYTWSLNNVVLGEMQHTALAYWQGGRPEEAYKLFKSSLVESMYIGASPGNFQQLSFYDAVRGELYRDFADDIGTTARSLVEGLFGIQPNLLQNKLTIKPGFPAAWNQASLTTPDISYSFQRTGNKEVYRFNTKFAKPLSLSLRLSARSDDVATISVNGKKATWRFDTSAVGSPILEIEATAGKDFIVEISWKGKAVEAPSISREDEKVNLAFKNAVPLKLYDPQKILMGSKLSSHDINANLHRSQSGGSFFVQTKQGALVYWLPVSVEAYTAIVPTEMTLNKLPSGLYEKIDLSRHFNDNVKNIFRNQYLSPRPKTTTLQLPTQGIGNWAYPLTTANIDDAGLRNRAREKGEYLTTEGIPFATPSDSTAKNIAFTSQWDNYPKSLTIPLSGRSSGAHLLMAGSTNPMQSRMMNGHVIVRYTDGSSDTLSLKNPENWWPIEQDYYEDGFAFTTGAPKPLRVYLKTGEDTRTFNRFVTIRGFSNRGIDGGAATVLEMPLNKEKELQSLTLKTIANDVVIGLMSLTLIR